MALGVPRGSARAIQRFLLDRSATLRLQPLCSGFHTASCATLQAATVHIPRRPAVGGRVAPLQQGRSFAIVTQTVKDFGAESITEGTLVEIKKKVGEAVTKGELVAVIETDKVSVEVLAEESGVVKEILAKLEDNVGVGQGLLKIEVGAAGAAPSASAAATPAASAPGGGGGGRIVEQAVKDFGAESITEGSLAEFRKKVGDAVTKGEVIAVIETDKVAMELTAEVSGVIKEILAKPDDTVTVGQVLVKLEEGAAGAAPAAGAPAAAAAAPAAAAPAAQGSSGDSLAGLAGIRLGFARARLAREGKLPEAAQAAPAAAAKSAAPVAAAPAAISVGEGRTERRVPMSAVRRRVIDRLKDAQNAQALLTTFQEVDMSASLAMRAKYGDLFKKVHGTPLGLLSLFIKASAMGLQDMPGVNGFIDDSAQEIIYRKYMDISVPIPSPRGPVSCVIRNAEAMSVSDIEHSIASLMVRARTDALSIEDLSPASFGIVDGGVSGSMLSTNFINPPASACLGTNAIQQRAVIEGGKLVARPVMLVALTYDHRLVDGREAVTFLGSVRDKLEDPSRLILNV